MERSDVWVIPQGERSRWFAHIDWYLNWQLTRGFTHSLPRMSIELIELLEESGMPVMTPELPAEPPLMVLPKGQIPAMACLLMPHSQSLDHWLKRIHTSLQTLKAKRARVFLPADATVNEAEKIWQPLPVGDLKVEFILDDSVES